MTKEEQLNKLKQEMAEDSSLPLQSNLVFGEGSAEAGVIFIGEAPGAKEDEQKRPFVGRSGQLLRKTMQEAANLAPEDVYITNIVKRRPPENRDPTPEEIAAYQPYLARQLAIIKPKVIVPLGRFAANYFVDGIKISKQQGTIFRKADGGKTLIIYPMFHPAAALRSTGNLKQFQKTFRKLPKVIAKYKELVSAQ